ncbi:MAG TPA: M1 family metallopeptidase [Ohtaekwangia sp.]
MLRAISLAVIIILVLAVTVSAQQTFTHQDSIRGSITKERAWWDVIRYKVGVQPDYNARTIQGTTVIIFKTLKPGSVMQIDLQQPMQIDSANLEGKTVKLTRDGNAYYLHLDKPLPANDTFFVAIKYSGKPREAKNPPWDGGWIWAKDKKGRPWMSVACQGLGASVWYPCKDHQSDEPDNGAVLAMTVPDSLTAIGNGRLIETKSAGNGLTTFTYTIKNPINNYNIIPYIGKYEHWHETYAGAKGNLDCDYWVLDYELEKAKKQFQQVPKMLKCFEHWFGPYPFYEDGYKLIQSPHLGMEHQSAIAYGNQFLNGYLGQDLSQSGWGTKWDFIIIHESGHEWFGNNITSKDLADMWIHESFTNYSETIFTTCEYGVEAGNDYVVGIRRNIRNDSPIIGPYSVNQEGSGDMYYKGGNMLHTIRQLVNDDEKFRSILRGLNETFWHKTVTTKEIENYMCKSAGKDFSKVFDQYLRTAKIPVLEYKITDGKLYYRWTDCVTGFDMKLKLKNGTWISPSEKWQTLKGTWSPQSDLEVDRNFYIVTKKATGA